MTSELTTTNNEQKSTSAVNYVRPLANIQETEDGFVLEAELPGVNKAGLELTVESGELTIVGHRAEAPVPGQQLYRESRGADYRRVFELDPSIDAGRISAKLDAGVLRVQLPRAESLKPRKIELGE